MTKFHFGVV